MSEDDGQKPTAAEALANLRDDPRGKHWLLYLDIIDAKVSAIFTFIGILIAAVVIFISRDEAYVSLDLFGVLLSQKIFIFASLAVLLVASLLALSCIHIIELVKLVERADTDEEAVERLGKIALSRRWRYLASLRLTALGTIIACFAVFMSV